MARAEQRSRRAQQELAGLDLAVQLVVRAAYDHRQLAEVLHKVDPVTLRVAAAHLALMTDTDLTVNELTQLAYATFDRFPCHPATWGRSWYSTAEHGTRARYNAGCGGAACRRADRAYRDERAAAKEAEQVATLERSS